MKWGIDTTLNVLEVDLDLSFDVFSSVIYIQDSTHIGTKLRNLLLKPSIVLPFGDKMISLAHLKILITNVSKQVHGLTQSDISPDDRMNYKSLEKVMEIRVVDALAKHVTGSQATITFITMCKYITSSFLDRSLRPTDRIYRIWYALFLLRIWRKSILDSEFYALKTNFVTSNAYACVEINAIGLIRLMIAFRKADKPELFLPYLFDSQPCERTFRQLRSMSSVNWTRINFCLLELLQMIERIDLENDIVFNKLADCVDFPRVNMDQTEKYPIYDLPSNQEIKNEISKAMNDAIEAATEYGMNFEPSDIIGCPLRSHEQKISITSPEQKSSGDFEEEKDDDESLFNDNELGNEQINLRCFDNVSIGEKSKYIQICENDGTIKNVLKSSLVWLLSDSNHQKLSNDRLKRVQTTPIQKIHKRAKIDQESEKKISVGDWCMFCVYATLKSNLKNRLDLPKSRYFENFLFGTVMGFTFSKGKNITWIQHLLKAMT